jgi:ABC-type phosphate transport system ATPase subunit
MVRPCHSNAPHFIYVVFVAPWGVKPSFILKEPTSALDPASTATVEKTIIEEVRTKSIKAIVWITHSEEQAARVGTRFLQLSPSGVYEESANGQL